MSGPKGQLAEAIAAYHAASLAVLTSDDVWLEEQASNEARLLAWPRPCEGTQLNRLLSMLFDADVNVALVLLRADDDPRSPAWPPNVRDPKMQVLLRVVQRSMQSGEAAIVAQFGGLELNGRRDFNNLVNEQVAAYALGLAAKTGWTRDEAFSAVGLPRRAGFRAVKRTHRKK